MHAEFIAENPEGKKQLRRPRGKWQYNSKVDVKEIDLGEMDSVPFQQDKRNAPRSY